MNKFGLQLYTLRKELSSELSEEAMKKVKELGYSYVQVAGDLATIERTGLLARNLGLEVIGSVGAIDDILYNFDETIRVHKAIGAFDVGVSASFKSATEVEEYIVKANALADRLAEHGLTFSYHNHAKEFIRMENGKLPYDMLIDGLTSKNAYFMPDTYWIQYGGKNPVKEIKKLAGRLPCVHFKDYAIARGPREQSIRFAPIGSGNLDWDEIIAACKESGVKYALIEQDNSFGADPFECLKISYDFLISKGLEAK